MKDLCIHHLEYTRARPESGILRRGIVRFLPGDSLDANVMLVLRLKPAMDGQGGLVRQKTPQNKLIIVHQTARNREKTRPAHGSCGAKLNTPTVTRMRDLHATAEDRPPEAHFLDERPRRAVDVQSRRRPCCCDACYTVSNSIACLSVIIPLLSLRLSRRHLSALFCQYVSSHQSKRPWEGARLAQRGRICERDCGLLLVFPLRPSVSGPGVFCYPESCLTERAF